MKMKKSIEIQTINKILRPKVAKGGKKNIRGVCVNSGRKSRKHIQPGFSNGGVNPAKAIKSLLQVFLQHLQLLNYSPYSIKIISCEIGRLYKHLIRQGIKDITQLTPQILQDYKCSLLQFRKPCGNPISPSTIRRNLYALRVFFRFLEKKRYLPEDPAKDLTVPKAVRALPRGILTLKEINRIFKEPDLRTVLGYRDRTLLEVLYSTGIRVGELVGLKITDVDLEQKLLRITRGKGGKDRLVPLNTPTCRFLKRYIEKIRGQIIKTYKAKAQTDKLFINYKGEEIDNNSVRWRIKTYMKQAGIKKPDLAPCHSFRHSIATHLLEKGMDLRYVQVFLGHSTMGSTQVYTHVQTGKMKSLLKKYHPREINPVRNIERFGGNDRLNEIKSP